MGQTGGNFRRPNRLNNHIFKGTQTVTELKRRDIGERYCRSIVHNGTVYLSGLTAAEAGTDVRSQTRRILEKIDHHRAEAGSDKTRLLSVQLHLRDGEKERDRRNAECESWIVK